MNMKIVDFLSNRRTEERISYFVIACVIAVISFLILYKADWILGDNYEFLISTAAGKPEPLSFHIGLSRFYPLGHYDYNILTLIPNATSALAHYIYVAVTFTVLICLFCSLVNKAGREYGSNTNLYLTALFTVLLTASVSFLTCFLNVIYPERILMVLFAVFMRFSAVRHPEKRIY